MKYSLSIIFAFFFLSELSAQTGVMPGHELYADTSVAVIRILIDPDSLAQIFLHDSLESDYEYPADFYYSDGAIVDSMKNIGFRIRGNTSRYSQKKSFKVSFNTFVKGRKFYGVEKLNLNGEHNDPSMTRAKLSWDLFNAFGVSSSRARHVRLYINGAYYGLYISVEHIDENFALYRFGNNDGNLYKCLYPADLADRGTDPEAYRTFTVEGRRVYELKINEERDDYSDLAAFIVFLNRASSPEFVTEIEDRFNVPQFMKILAVDVSVGSWDDYWYLKNNYYLYNNRAENRFEFIPYDYDNTFGIDWFNIDWGIRTIYSWGNLSEPRPLVTRILAVQKYRDWFSYFVRKLQTQLFDPIRLNPRIDSLHTLITAAAEEDTFRTKDYGYTVQDFHESFSQPQGAHVKYGIKPFIVTRRNATLAQVEIRDIFPILYEVRHEALGRDSVRISAVVEDDSADCVVTVYREEPDGTFTEFRTQSDGLTYTVVVPRGSPGAALRYAVGAKDVVGKESLLPTSAPERLFTVPGMMLGTSLVVNEFMASNNLTVNDEYGSAEDWIEIYNNSTEPVNLKGKYLTDNLSSPSKWALPDTTLPAGGFALVWADDTPSKGKFHAPYKLDKGGEQIGIFDSTAQGFVVLDSLTFGQQTTDVSMGRFPDGSGAFQMMNAPTPGAPNVLSSILGEGDAVPSTTRLEQNFPNPFNPVTTLRFIVTTQARVKLSVYDIRGAEVAVLFDGIAEPAAWHSVEFDAAHVSSGVYVARLTVAGSALTAKMLVVK